MTGKSKQFNEIGWVNTIKSQPLNNESMKFIHSSSVCECVCVSGVFSSHFDKLESRTHRQPFRHLIELYCDDAFHYGDARRNEMGNFYKQFERFNWIIRNHADGILRTKKENFHILIFGTATSHSYLIIHHTHFDIIKTVKIRLKIEEKKTTTTTREKS